MVLAYGGEKSYLKCSQSHSRGAPVPEVRRASEAQLDGHFRWLLDLVAMTGPGDAGIAKASLTWSRKTVLVATEPRYTTQGWFPRYLEDDQKTSLSKNSPA